MQPDNHDFWKNERRIFFTERLDTHHGIERTREIIFLARDDFGGKMADRCDHPQLTTMLCPTGSRTSAEVWHLGHALSSGTKM
jgi:hypothetical protein